MHRIAIAAALTTLTVAAPLAAQSNTVPGLDGRIVDVNSLTYWGRRGAAYPNGEVGLSMLNFMCNPGSVNIPWFAAMASDHPKFGFIITRVSGGRMVQISDWSYVKHAFLSVNGSGTCGTCIVPGVGGAMMGVHCDDTYGAGNNGDRYWLGPPSEIDPWLGTWNPVGSYFDRGDPPVAVAQQTDGVRSLSNAQIAAFDAVKNLVTVKEQDLSVAGAQYFYGIQLIHQGEASANRGDNIASRGFTPVGSASGWTTNNSTAPLVYGSILTRWAGATVDGATNGSDDGHFYVGVNVTGPVGGLYHYEYAVHNIDNNRGGAALHIPVCSSAVISNLGFRDIDSNALNDWTGARVGNEVVFSASASNPLNWNQIFNFWFDATVAPAAGQVQVDEARVGTGALSVLVNARIPSGMPQVTDLGPGCGSPAPTLSVTGTPTVPNAAFFLQIQSSPNASLLLFAAYGSANLPLGNGCVQYLEQQSIMTIGFLLTGITGHATVPMPIPNDASLSGLTIDWQVAQLTAGGPALSNGVALLIGNNPLCH
jgi:hypothetical protein